MALNQLAGFLATILPWSNIVLVGAAIYFLWLIIKGGKDVDVAGKAWGLGKEAGGKVAGAISGAWGKDARKAAKQKKKIQRHAKREKTRALGEYIEEKEEVKLLKIAQERLTEFEAQVEEEIRNGLTIPNELNKKFDKLEEAVVDANDEITKLKKVTFRQERKSQILIKDLDNAGADDKALRNIKAMEKDILLRHDKVIENMGNVVKVIGEKGDVGKEMKKLVLPGGAVDGRPYGMEVRRYQGDLVNIRNALGGVGRNLEMAKEEQKQAYKDTEGFIAAFHKLWEKS